MHILHTFSGMQRETSKSLFEMKCSGILIFIKYVVWPKRKVLCIFIENPESNLKALFARKPVRF